MPEARGARWVSDKGITVMQPTSRLPGILLVGMLVCFMGTRALGAEDLAVFDLSRPEVAGRWKPIHSIGRMTPTPEGLEVEIAGPDPYFGSPRVDLPAGADLWMHVRLWSEQGGAAQVFFYEDGGRIPETQSVRFATVPGVWTERRLAVRGFGPKTRFRIDPPGDSGRAVVASVRLSRRVTIEPPEWPKAAPPDLPADAPAVRSGDLTVRHSPGEPGRFAVEVAGRPMAAGLRPARIGYLGTDEVRWIPWQDGHRDPDGGTWRIGQTFRANAKGGIDLTVRVTVDRPRDVAYLPLCMLVAGQGTFGSAKHQAVFAGLEYLANEPSSSEADIRGPYANRQVPDTLKLTFPLMAVAAQGRYVGLVWERAPMVAAVFDSPDRLFDSGGHVMGLAFPGADQQNRAPGSLMPHWPTRLEVNQPLVLHATIIGGTGDTVVPAVQQYVRLCGLPAVPDPMDAAAYVRLAAAGWLDSGIRDGHRFRHAVWSKWDAHPAAGPAAWMRHLAGRTPDEGLAKRLEATAADAIGAVQPGAYLYSGVSHVRAPVVPLVFGHVAEAVGQARSSARRQLRRFEPDGRLLYRQAKDRPDYAQTHWAREANGLAARPVRDILEAAIYCGDKDLAGEGLRLLRVLDRFAGTVPRGAQTWEIPLHTPDILASAHLVRAYTLGYELTGDAHFLEQARYWAWTGVPFVYLTNPTDRPVGPYSTIAVLGATNWKAPVWFGRPVQWCGLVYADALYGLARHDAEGSWRTLADGITAAGIQHTWREDDTKRQGLLPDWFALRQQVRAGPAINPGTVQANAIRLLGMPPIYDYAVCRKAGVTVHAPGQVEIQEEGEESVTVRIAGWPKGPYWVLVSGLSKAPKVTINGTETPLAAPHQYLDSGALVLRLEGACRVDLRL